MLQTISIKVTGKVQGVFYRQSALEKARVLGVNGTVCNLRDGAVQIIATATAAQLSQLLAWCRQGPERAKVLTVETSEEVLQSFPDFRILR